MKINGEKVKQLRLKRGWSQEQLSELCGVNLRTIQRIEVRHTASSETINALCAIFEVSRDELIAEASHSTHNFGHPVLNGLYATVLRFNDFQGVSSRSEFWWFLLFFIICIAIADTIHATLGVVVTLLLIVPFLAVSSRRLIEAGHSPWWQLFYLVPFGQIPVLIMLALPPQPLETTDAK